VVVFSLDFMIVNFPRRARATAAACLLTAGGFAPAAGADPLEALKQKGWTLVDTGPPMRLEWHGSGANDTIQALLAAPEPSSAAPADLLNQLRARLGGLTNCQPRSDPGGAWAMDVCLQ
jgi:hypothetical protein